MGASLGPLQWSELPKKNFRVDAGYDANRIRALDQIEDPWKDFWPHTTSLEKARKKLEERHAA
jgi:hypothetical protein